MGRKNSHCSYCGAPFAESAPWPRRCVICERTSYLNPTPVAVVLVPVDEGLLLVRRTIPPQVGELCLPGGYVTLGETWQEAGAREVREETGLEIDPGEIREFAVRSAPPGDGHLLIFGLAAPRHSLELPPFVPNHEASERVIAFAPQRLAFPLHTEAADLFFARQPALV